MRVAVENEQDPAKQAKEMAAARKRWDALVEFLLVLEYSFAL